MRKKVFLEISQNSQACNFIKKLWHRCFPVNFLKFLRKVFLTEHLRWLLLNIERIFWEFWKYLFWRTTASNCFWYQLIQYRKCSKLVGSTVSVYFLFFFSFTFLENLSALQYLKNFLFLYLISGQCSHDVFKGYKMRTLAGNVLVKQPLIYLATVSKIS